VPYVPTQPVIDGELPSLINSKRKNITDLRADTDDARHERVAADDDDDEVTALLEGMTASGQNRLTGSTVGCLLSPAADMPPTRAAPLWAKSGLPLRRSYVSFHRERT
jgi:hypothetical protein